MIENPFSTELEEGLQAWGSHGLNFESLKNKGSFHLKLLVIISFQAGLSAAPTRAISAVKNISIPQQIKDIKLPELPQAIKDLKLWLLFFQIFFFRNLLWIAVAFVGNYLDVVNAKNQVGVLFPMRLCHCQVALLVPYVSLLHSLIVQKQFCLNKMKHFSSGISAAI